MSVFVSKQELNDDFFEELHFCQEMKNRHQQAKNRNRACLTVLEELQKTNPELTEKLYLKVAENWRRASGGMTQEKDEVLGKRLSHYHMEDPFVHQTIVDLMAGRKDDPELQRASTQKISTGVKKIKSADSFETECTVYCLPNPSEKFHKHLSLAHEALSFAARHMPFSGNNSRVSDVNPSVIDLKVISGATQKIQDTCTEKCSKEYLEVMHGIYSNSFTKRLKQNRIYEKAITGNCAELSNIAFSYLLKERQTDMKVDLFGIGNGNHAFLVFGRPWDSDFSDWTTWGPDAIVCDPWARRIFPASYIPYLLEDCVGIDNLYRAKVARFDPKGQSLLLLTSTIYSVQDLQKEWEPLPTIAQMLEAFHSIPSHHQREKMRQAERLIEAIEQFPHDDLLENKPLSCLLAQMHCLMGFSKPGLIQTPLSEALRTAEHHNKPKIFEKAIDQGLCPFSLIMDYGLCAAKKTKNLKFFKIAIDLRSPPTEQTFMFALLVAMKTEDLDPLRHVVKNKARADTDDYARADLSAKKTKNLEYLSLAIQAGGEPTLARLLLTVQEAIKTQDTSVLELLSRTADYGQLIKYHLTEEIKKCPISEEFSKKLDAALRTSNYFHERWVTQNVA